MRTAHKKNTVHFTSEEGGKLQRLEKIQQHSDRGCLPQGSLTYQANAAPIFPMRLLTLIVMIVKMY